MSELTKPLHGKPPRRIAGISIVGVLLTLLGLGLVGAVVTTILAWDPGTTATAPIETPASTGDVVIRAPEEGGNAGVTITTPGGAPANGAGVVIREPGAAPPIALTTEVNQALLESGHYGPIPRIGPDGLRPLDAYLRPLPPGGMTGRPRIAIIIGGLGLGRAGTQLAIDVLPPEISLALAPYGANLRTVASDARAAGHEIFLQVPLEPFDFPANDPGEHTLIVDDPAAANIDRLEWLMTQFNMYAGVVTYAGGRFTGEAEALQPLVGELARRGLMFVDDGASARSVSANVSVGVVAYARADLVIDTVDDQTAVANRLAQLEALAQQRGFAIGSGSAFPNTIEAVRAWAATALSRGYEIVPVTALRVDPLEGTLIQVP
ncbi:MAG: divergent polysaccharide deacetylase family protein [Bauldia sp.]|nr:divergent polysaccharide deacetylase family protein [Bauldia sp.]